MATMNKLIIIFKSVFEEIENLSEEKIQFLTKDQVATWDSSNHFILISSIENEFDITLSDNEVMNIDSFQQALLQIELKQQ